MTKGMPCLGFMALRTSPWVKPFVMNCRVVSQAQSVFRRSPYIRTLPDCTRRSPNIQTPPDPIRHPWPIFSEMLGVFFTYNVQVLILNRMRLVPTRTSAPTKSYGPLKIATFSMLLGLDFASWSKLSLYATESAEIVTRYWAYIAYIQKWIWAKSAIRCPDADPKCPFSETKFLKSDEFFFHHNCVYKKAQSFICLCERAFNSASALAALAERNFVNT